LAAHLETAFSGINQGVIVQNSGSEDCEFVDNFQQFLVGLQGGPSGTDSHEVFDSLPGAASAAIGEEENGFFVDSDLVDDLLTDEESDKNADSSSLPEVDDELVAMFRGEAAEHLREFDTSTQVLSKLVHGRSPIEGEIQKAIQKIRRSAHTIKGASAVIGMQNLSNLSGRIEDFVDWLHDTAQFVTIEIVNDLIKLLDLLQVKICTPEHFNELHAAELLESLQATIDSYPTGDDG
jgi:HPt (histidine-containing phosphotransfer) domain-containing protein